MNNIVFDEATHTYSVDGVIYPSVTDICKPISFERLNSINKWVVENASKRGSQVHEACQMFMLTGEFDEDEYSNDILPYMFAFKNWYDTFKPKVMFCEYMLCNLDDGYCGTCDLVAEIDGVCVLIDIKTTSALDKRFLEVQTAGYSRMLKKNGVSIDKCYALHLKKDQKYSFVEVTPDNEWFDALLLHTKKLLTKRRKSKQ